MYWKKNYARVTAMTSFYYQTVYHLDDDTDTDDVAADDDLYLQQAWTYEDDEYDCDYRVYMDYDCVVVVVHKTFFYHHYLEIVILIFDCCNDDDDDDVDYVTDDVDYVTDDNSYYCYGDYVTDTELSPQCYEYYVDYVTDIVDDVGKSFFVILMVDYYVYYYAY